jgi:hypothetical protein
VLIAVMMVLLLMQTWAVERGARRG